MEVAKMIVVRSANDRKTARFGRDSRASIGFVDRAVSWFLKCPLSWSRLIELYRVPICMVPLPCKIGEDCECLRKHKEKLKWKYLPIPRQPPGHGTMWAKVFRSLAKWFREELARIRPVSESDRWTSYSLCYIALRACARLGKHEEFSYVFSACKNSLKRHLAWERRGRALQPEDVDGVEYTPWSEIDLMLDLEDALKTLKPEDASICRWYLIDELKFEEIGGRLGGLNRSTVKRRFDRCLAAIKASLTDYDVGRANQQANLYAGAG